MDILRKELNAIYESQGLRYESLEESKLRTANAMAKTVAEVSGGCAVVTDASCNRCYVVSGGFGEIIGLSCSTGICQSFDSSDEDDIYHRIHPEDIVEKRMLEYEFFKLIDSLPPAEKKLYRATSRFRMQGSDGVCRIVDNSTQVIELSPAGKIWLILCCYNLSPVGWGDNGIGAAVVNSSTGEIRRLSFDGQRQHILSEREKEVLKLIRDGKPSKQIADKLGISIHTVNRHRQNIIDKLNVGNSVEAVMAATLMRIL